MENFDKNTPVEISSVFGTREHIDSQRVFWKTGFPAFK